MSRRNDSIERPQKTDKELVIRWRAGRNDRRFAKGCGEPKYTPLKAILFRIDSHPNEWDNCLVAAGRRRCYWTD